MKSKYAFFRARPADFVCPYEKAFLQQKCINCGVRSNFLLESKATSCLKNFLHSIVSDYAIQVLIHKSGFALDQEICTGFGLTVHTE